MSSLNVCVVAFEGVSLFHLSVPAMVLGAGDEWPDSARMTVGFWPFSAGRHYGVRGSSRMQTLGRLECN